MKTFGFGVRTALGIMILGLGRPALAQAHLVTTGLGPVYDGFSHFFLSLEDAVAVLALGILAGMNGPAAGRRVLFTITTAWILGGAIGFSRGGPPLPGIAASISFLLLGGLVALDRRLTLIGVTALAAALGLWHGWENGVDLVAAGRGSLALVGIVGSVFLVSTLAAAAVLSLQAGWTRIVFRVAGSWVAATGLLLLGWSLRGGT